MPVCTRGAADRTGLPNRTRSTPSRTSTTSGKETSRHRTDEGPPLLSLSYLTTTEARLSPVAAPAEDRSPRTSGMRAAPRRRLD